MISANLHGLTVSITSLQHDTAALPAGCRCVGNPGACCGMKCFKVQRATSGKPLALEVWEL